MLRYKTKTEPDNCVWIGGLNEEQKDHDFNKKLKAHFEGLGCPSKFVEIGFKGTGGAVFTSAEEAAAAIAAVNGTKFKGKTLEVDVWTKKEKTEKTSAGGAKVGPRPARKPLGGRPRSRA